MRRFSALFDLSEAERLLVTTALQSSGNAYAPYSGFAVGAAVRTRSGNVYIGANLENASYGLSMCAEVAALTAANTAGDFEVDTIAVAGHKFTAPESVDLVVTPCGRCRQMIFEASQISKVDVRVLSCSADLTTIFDATISEMLPEAFGPQNVGVQVHWPEMQSVLRAAASRLCRER